MGINMKLSILGCAGGIGGREKWTTCLRLDEDILFDAGTGLATLDMQALIKIDHLFLTHAHLDHVAGLALLVDAVQGKRSHPIIVHATQEVIAVLRQHLFNWHLWPDFGAIPSEQAPVLRWDALPLHTDLSIKGRTIYAAPVNHTSGSVAYLVSQAQAGFMFTGDMCSTPSLWKTLAARPQIRQVIIDCSFSNAEADLAQRSLHFCPDSLLREVEQISQQMEFLIYHLKPGQEDLIMQELQQPQARHQFSALRSGDRLDF